MSSKAILKSINDAIRQQQYGDAVAKARSFLEKEPKNYQAYV
jgi:superkiller protein 3